ncbi:MAG: NUDIX hydrolase [Alphaproteobacteria bacterium]|nr:NUDIX hydrolase [Alphaproteobacteria bacterium]
MSTQTNPPSSPVLGVSIACWRGDEVLLAKRGKAPSKGLWSLPGGHVELGERLADAALRELGEETAVAAEIEGLATTLDIIRHDETGAVSTHYVIAVFKALWLEGEACAGDDAAAVQWRRAHDLADLEMTPGTADLLAAMTAGAPVMTQG